LIIQLKKGNTILSKFLIFSYSLFLIFFVIFSYLFVDLILFYLKFLFSNFAYSKRTIVSIGYFVLILIFFIFYLTFSAQEGINAKKVILITTLILIFSYPAMLSFDVFNYMATAKVLFQYRENPYIIMPIELTNEPLLKFMHAANKTALYGPTWILLTFVPYFLGFGNFLITIFSFKLLSAIGYFGICFLIWKIKKDNKSLLLFALNPLVLIETITSSHNDSIMVFFAIMSMYFIKEKKYLFFIISIFISVGIKYATVFLIPIYLIILIRQWRKKSIDWNKIFLLSCFSMFTIFLLSSFREEIYPWYAIWFLPFLYLSKERKLFFWIFQALSFSLLLRYIPFMYSGTYFGPTPYLKILLTIMPVIVLIFIWLLNRLRKV